jgi:protoporphyrinogen oxidase
MMWEMLQDRIALLGGSVRTREEVTEVHHDGQQVTHVVTRSSNNRTADIHAPQFISTMALDDLIARLRPAPPAEVLHAAASLRYRDFVLVGLVVRRTGLFADNWLYIHSPNVRVGRIQNFGNWSADLVPEPGTSSIGMEYFCNRGDSTWTQPDDEFVRLASKELEQLGLAKASDVAWGVVIRQPKAYPVYDTTYRGHLDVLRAWLPKLSNFQTIGRNGQHRYNNQDHSMLTGLAAVHRIMGDSADPWEVNTERSYYEEQRVNRSAPTDIRA